MAEAGSQVDINSILQTVINSLNAPARQMPSYKPVSTAAFDAEVAAARQLGATTDQIGAAGLQTMTNATGAIQQGARDQATAGAEIVAQQQLRAESIARMAEEVSSLFGGDSRIAQLAAEASATRDIARQEKEAIAQRASVSFLDDPLTWLENQLVLPGVVQQQNAKVSKAAAMEDEISKLLANKTNMLNYNVRTVPAMTAAESEAKARQLAAEAATQGAVAERELASSSIQFANQQFARHLSLVGMAGQQLNNTQQEAQREYTAAIQAVNAAQTEEGRRLQAAQLLLTMEKSIGKEASNDSIARQFEVAYSLPAGSVSSEFIARLSPAIRANLNAISVGAIGTGPASALMNFAELGVQFGNSPQGAAKDALRQRVEAVVGETPTMQQLRITNAKPTITQVANADREAVAIIGRQFANPEASNPATSLTRVPSPGTFFMRGTNGTVGPRDPFIVGGQIAGLPSQTVMTLGKVLEPLLDTRQQVPATAVVSTIYESVKKNGGDQKQAAALISDYFRAAVAARNASANYGLFGIRVSPENPADISNTYQVVVDRPGFFTGTQQVDLTKPESVQGLLIIEDVRKQFQGVRGGSFIGSPQ